MVDMPNLPHYRKWSEVPKNLVSKTTLRKQKLKPGTVRATVYQRLGHQTKDIWKAIRAKGLKAE